MLGAGGGRRGAGDSLFSHAPRPTLHAPLLLALWLFPAAPVWSETADRIVAIVNEDVITQSDVSSSLSQALAVEESPEPLNATDPALYQVVLRHLIEQRLILQEAKAGGIVVGADEVLQRLEELRHRAGPAEAFQQFLDDSGLSLERLKEKLREQLMVQRLIDEKVRSTIVISPQEVAKALGHRPPSDLSGEQVRVLHLLVRVNDQRSETEARALIEDLHRRAMKGTDFSALARRYSEDPHADDGGRMGWRAKGELLAELDAAAFGLAPGEISVPIQSRLGFHLLKVEERRTVSAPSTTEAHQAAYQRLYQQQFEQAFNRWLDELRRKAYIEILASERG